VLALVSMSLSALTRRSCVFIDMPISLRMRGPCARPAALSAPLLPGPLTLAGASPPGPPAGPVLPCRPPFCDGEPLLPSRPGWRGFLPSARSLRQKGQGPLSTSGNHATTGQGLSSDSRYPHVRWRVQRTCLSSTDTPAGWKHFEDSRTRARPAASRQRVMVST